MPDLNRRTFLQTTTALTAAALSLQGTAAVNTPDDATAFRAHQAARREELWALLGKLPERKPPTATLLSREQREGYTLEHLTLDLNGIEPVPALMLIPDNLKAPAPAIHYLHWHGGDYFVGKQELLTGTRAMQAYAPVYAQKGIAALAIDSWCFGERAPYKVEKDSEKDSGKRGEEDTFKEMLWKGRVLFGMMLFDEWQALNYLCTRPEIDPRRIAAFGISMGATKAWWLAALDERISCCIDLCCLTDYQSLIEDKGLRRHGIYYYVPSLLEHFQSADINELIVPRPRLSLNGKQDGLTPPRGVEKIRDHLLPLYQKYGHPQNCHIELFDCPHQELPEMREKVLAWLDRYLAS